LHWEKLFLLRGTVEEAFGVFSITIEKLVSLPRNIEKLNQQTTKTQRIQNVKNNNKPLRDFVSSW
jgi:hypothetical protein